MGVGLMNQLMAASASGTSGVDWAQATKIGESLLFSPLIGFSVAALLAADRQGAHPHSGALQGAQGQQAAAPVDSRTSGADLHRRELRARIERRPERHGTHHADPDRHRADGLRAQPHHARAGCRHASSRSRRRRRPRSAHYAKGPAPADPHAGCDRYRALSLGHAGEHCPRSWRSPRRFSSQVDAPIRMDKVPAGRDGQHSQRDVSGERGPALPRQVEVDRRLRRRQGERSPRTRRSSTIRPSSFRPGSRSRWRSRSASAP